MTSPVFSVFITSHFGRGYRKLAAKQPDLPVQYGHIVAVLRTDPYNHSRVHSIKKLEGIAAGNGQWRIRAGRFRFRYDIEGAAVYLKACALRDESTYRR